MSGLRNLTRRAPTDAGSLRTRDEAFRVLRSNVLVAISDLANPVVIVTSALPQEGKTSTCTTLAGSLASAGRRVVVVDLDLRHPDVHSHLHVQNDTGVSDVLTGSRSLQECLKYVALGRDAGLYLLSTGPVVDYPTELLGGPRVGDMLDALARQADIVLVDTPPVLPVADTLVIGRLAAGALLVVETGRVPIDAVERAKAALTRSQTRILGLVLNRFDETGTGGTSQYGYGYGAVSPGFGEPATPRIDNGT